MVFSIAAFLCELRLSALRALGASVSQISPEGPSRLGNLPREAREAHHKTPVAFHHGRSIRSSAPLRQLLLARGCFSQNALIFQECSTGENYCHVLLYLDAFKDKKNLFSTLSFHSFCFLAAKGPRYLYFQGLSVLCLLAGIVPWGSRALPQTTATPAPQIVRVQAQKSPRLLLQGQQTFPSPRARQRDMQC